MTDFSQATSFPQGVVSPVLSGANSLVFNDGYNINTTPTPVSLLLGASNVGVYNFSITSGFYINGKFSVKVIVAGAVSVIALEVVAQAYIGAAAVSNQIQIISVGDLDKNVCNFKSASLMKNSITNEMAVILSFNLNSPTSSNMSVSLDTIGNTTINITPTISSWGSSAIYTYADSRDAVMAMSQRINGQNISLNSLTSPCTVSCNPTDIGSRPSGSSGIGTCMVISSGDSRTQITQIFTDSTTLKSYIRTMGSDGVTWSSWAGLISDTDIAQIIQTNFRNSMLDSIVFG